MSQASDLLNSLSADNVTVYANGSETEKHIVIGEDRIITVPESLRRIAVQHDHNVETVTFDCPRYWDGIDLSTMAIYINYLCPNRTLGAYIAQNVTIDESDSNIMHFDWTITRNITVKNGKLSFLVCIKNVDSEGNEINHWNSELNTDMYVSEGLETTEALIETVPDLLTQILLLNELTLTRASVYVGSGDMPEWANVQIDPDGEAGGAAGGGGEAVLYTAQSLTEAQQAQARANIGAGTPYTLPQASSNAIGGIKADAAETADTQPVRIGVDGKLYTAPGGGADISLGIIGATSGQMAKVKSVDASGVPTAWEALDAASGEEWEFINEISTNEWVSSVTINQDSNGNPFSLKKMRIFMTLPKTTNEAGEEQSNPGYALYTLNGRNGPYQSPSTHWESALFLWTIEAFGDYYIVSCWRDGANSSTLHHIDVFRDAGYFESITSFTWKLFNANYGWGSTNFKVYGVKA